MENFIHHWGYLALIVLTLAESCCIPLPSEIVVGYAGVLAHQGRLNLALVILLATLGELVGAYIAWAVGRTGGRALVERYGKYVLLTHRELDRAEAWVHKRGEWGILVGRCVPLVRTFISVPAGITEMEPVRFGAFTAGGSLIWCGALAAIGYSLAGSWNTIAHRFQQAGYVIAALAVLAVAFLVWHRLRDLRSERAAVAAEGDVPVSDTASATED